MPKNRRGGFFDSYCSLRCRSKKSSCSNRPPIWQKHSPIFQTNVHLYFLSIVKFVDVVNLHICNTNSRIELEFSINKSRSKPRYSQQCVPHPGRAYGSKGVRSDDMPPMISTHQWRLCIVKHLQTTAATSCSTTGCKFIRLYMFGLVGLEWQYIQMRFMAPHGVMLDKVGYIVPLDAL